MLILPWKFMFMTILISGSLIAISASSWMMAWMGLEINLLALLALIMVDKTPRNSEAALKYFLIQALASAILISSALVSSTLFSFMSSMSLFSSFIIISLLIKLGSSPFHMWMPQVVEGLNWNNNMIILTWQKLAPFILLSSCLESKLNFYLITTAIILSSLLGAIMGLTQTSIRKILAFSSINHIGWMLAAISQKISLWSIYFISYTLLLILVLSLISANNLTSISGTFFSSNLQDQIPFFTALLSFGGLPPLMGFLPKWLVAQELASSSILLLMIMVTSSLMALFFYSRIMFSHLLSKQYLVNKTKISSKGGVVMMINLSGLLLTPILFSF